MSDSKKSQSSNPFAKVFDPVVECYGRAALTGLASFWFVFSTSHFIQKPIRTRFGYPTAGSLAISTSLAGTVRYFMVKSRLEKCQKLKSISKFEDS